MNRLKIAAAGVLVLLAAACGSHPNHGTVVTKRYDPPTVYWTSSCVMYDKKGVCKVSMPVRNEYPAHWYITLAGDDEEGKPTQWDIEIDQVTWSTVKAGQEWPPQVQPSPDSNDVEIGP